MPLITETEAFRACRILFGAELPLSRDFLHYLQPAGVRTAYRSKAKTIHPDRFAVAAEGIRESQHRQFQDLQQAYEIVLRFLKQRDRLSPGRTAADRAASGPPQGHRSHPHCRSRYYRGPLPPRPLQFGLYLYYLGIIPFSALISAIAWQRRQRPMLGEIARRWGWLDDTQVHQVVKHRSGAARFGERAQQLGLLSPIQVRAILLHQRTRQKQMGDYFVEQGYFDTETLNALLARLAEHNQAHRQGFSGQFYFHHRG